MQIYNQNRHDQAASHGKFLKCQTGLESAPTLSCKARKVTSFTFSILASEIHVTLESVTVENAIEEEQEARATSGKPVSILGAVAAAGRHIAQRRGAMEDGEEGGKKEGEGAEYFLLLLCIKLSTMVLFEVLFAALKETKLAMKSIHTS